MTDFVVEPALSLVDVAQMFHVTTQTVRKWTKSGPAPLEARKVGGKIYTTASAVRRFAGVGEVSIQQTQDPNYEAACRNLKERHGF